MRPPTLAISLLIAFEEFVRDRNDFATETLIVLAAVDEDIAHSGVNCIRTLGDSTAWVHIRMKIEDRHACGVTVADMRTD